MELEKADKLDAYASVYQAVRGWAVVVGSMDPALAKLLREAEEACRRGMRENDTRCDGR